MEALITGNVIGGIAVHVLLHYCAVGVFQDIGSFLGIFAVRGGRHEITEVNHVSVLVPEQMQIVAAADHFGALGTDLGAGDGHESRRLRRAVCCEVISAQIELPVLVAQIPDSSRLVPLRQLAVPVQHQDLAHDAVVDEGFHVGDAVLLTVLTHGADGGRDPVGAVRHIGPSQRDGAFGSQQVG